MSPLLMLAGSDGEGQNMKAEQAKTTLEFSGHKKVTADIDISRADFREHHSSHGLPTVKSSSSHWEIGTHKGKSIRIFLQPFFIAGA